MSTVATPIINIIHNTWCGPINQHSKEIAQQRSDMTIEKTFFHQTYELVTATSRGIDAENEKKHKSRLKFINQKGNDFFYSQVWPKSNKYQPIWTKNVDTFHNICNFEKQDKNCSPSPKEPFAAV